MQIRTFLSQYDQFQQKKTKVIWEDLVNIKKVWHALHWLKIHNFLYSQINIPLHHEELLSILNNQQLQFDVEPENTDENQVSDDVENNEIANNEKVAALLTQKDECDPFYEQYTIYPLYGSKMNETDTKLYQMLHVYANVYNCRAKDLDIKCFPDLFPTGKHGQYDERITKLRAFDFIKSRLNSKHPKFRLNIQYLFFCLFNNTIRQLSAGIFHKLNITNHHNKCTAAELIQKLNKGELEDNMTSVDRAVPGILTITRYC